jgi:hypothetical protein
MLQVPAALAERASQDLGAAGRSWIEHLPEIITTAQRHWSLTPRSVLPLGKELSVLIAVTTADGQPAVLKVCYPDVQPRHEAAALCRWAGHGAAALLREHPDQGLLLLEQLAPHRSLRAVHDAAALPIAAEVLHQLWVPPRQHSFPEQAARVRHWLTLIPGRGPDCLLRRVRRPPAEAARGFLVLAGDVRRDLAVGVRVEDDAVTAQLGNCRHQAIVRRSHAVRTGFSGPLAGFGR